MLLGTLAGLLAGFVVLGFGGRLVMTAIGLILGARPDWSLAGSLQVIVLGAALGPPSGLLYGLVRCRLPHPSHGTGLLFGALFGSAIVAVYFLRPAGPVELQAAPRVGALLFGGLLLLFGVSLEATLRRLEHAGSHFQPGLLALVATFAFSIGCFGLGLWALISR